MSAFQEDLTQLTESMERHRADLLTALSSLDDADLVRARRGGWTVGKVLEHIVGAEWHYAHLVASLRGLPEVTPEAFTAATVGVVSGALGRSRKVLLDALDGVSEGDFYRLGTVGREEYSIVSVLENVDQHDIEHLGQIRLIQAEPSVSA